jgi:flagellar motor switch protein FliN
MKATTESLTNSEISGYLQACVENVCRSLEQGAATVVAAAKMQAQGSEVDFEALAESGVWMRFTAGETGEQAFLLSTDDALKLAKALRHEPVDGPCALGQNQLYDLVAMFSWAVQTTTRSLAARLGREVRLEFAGGQRPAWTPAAQAAFQLDMPPNAPVFLIVQVSSELAGVLQLIQGEVATASSQPEVTRPSFPANRVSHDTNIDPLMDVELEVNLRFGARQLLLKEVLELGPGSVVELSEQVDDPVELLVGKKVVARGDVVVIDGNYGLRVTEIASPRERIESLRK